MSLAFLQVRSLTALLTAMSRPVEPASAEARPGAAPAAAAATKRLAAVVGLAALGFVTLAHPSATRMHGWPLATVGVLLALLPLAVVTGGVLRAGSWRLPPGALLGGVVLLAVGATVSALASPFAAASLPRLWPTLGGVALFLWLHHAWSGPDPAATGRRRQAARGFALVGAALALVSAALWSRGTWPLPWLDRNAFPFGHSTYTGGAMVLLLPWLGLQIGQTRGLPRLGWLAATLCAGLVLVSTGSRGAVLALGAAGGLGAVAAVVAAPWRARHKAWFAVGALAAAVIGVMTNPRLRDLVVHQRWSETARESNAQRAAMLAAGWQLGLARPFAGWGPGTVPLAYPRVRAALDGGTENVLQLHSTPAQLGATAGAVGLAALGLLVAGTLAALRRAPRTPGTLAAGTSLVGYGLFALTDHQLDVPFFTAATAAGLAWLTASAPAATDRTRRGLPLALGLGLALAAGLVAPATWSDLQARRHYDHALAALGANDGTGYLRSLDAATATAPHDSYFAHRAAIWLVEQRGAAADPARQTALARDAAARLERSLATGAHEEFAHFNLGWLYLDLGEPTAAARHFHAAAQRVPDKGGVYFGLGLAHELSGRRDDAIRAFALELVNDPRSATSPAWEVPALAALRSAALAEAGRLLADLRPRHPAVARVEPWIRWWWGETDAAPSSGFNDATSAFAAALPAIGAGRTLPGAEDTPWRAAYAAWRRPESASGRFLALAGGDEAMAGALARRARAQRTDFRVFLTAPTGDETALVRTYRRQRPGYGVLALHPEGPPLADLHVVQENRAATDLAAGLFPGKGWLPGRFLLALRPDDPR